MWLKNFYVSPVCSPTRSSLLTGRYNYRTGVVDTFLGRSLMRPDVKTLPEYLAAAGDRTRLFGKWHLGDNYPLRPEDRGFQETLWSRGGGLAQPSDHPDTNPKTAYFDPMLNQNCKEVRTKGYCTDVFTDAALKFVSAESTKPFFAYVAFNAPHAPYQVPDEFAAKYAKLDLSANAFPKTGQPWTTAFNRMDGKGNLWEKTDRAGDIAKAYGMIENIDVNFGRLMKALEEKKLAENTIVIFLTDNGPGGVRWNAGLRNRKGTVYEGGASFACPCYVRWPARSSRPGTERSATPLVTFAHRHHPDAVASCAGRNCPTRRSTARSFAALAQSHGERGQLARPHAVLPVAPGRTNRRKYRAFGLPAGCSTSSCRRTGVAPGGEVDAENTNCSTPRGRSVRAEKEPRRRTSRRRSRSSRRSTRAWFWRT